MMSSSALQNYVLYATGPRLVVIRRLSEPGPVTIGRSRTADVTLNDPLVSRIGEERIASQVEIEIEIEPGQEIKLGGTTLVVEG